MLNPESAHRTLDALTSSGFAVGVAMIVKNEDGSSYLHIYSGLVDLLGPTAAYTRLRDVIVSTASAIPLHQIRLLSFASPEARALSGAFSVDNHASVVLKDSNVNGVIFDDVILLRTPPRD